MTLYISMTTPSSELDKSPIDEAITRMAAQVAMERRSGNIPTEGPDLDITFMLTTQQDAPDFSGMRIGGYTKENNTLYIETVVPEVVAHSNIATRYVTAVLQDAIDHASVYFEEYNVHFDTESWVNAIHRMIDASGSGQALH